nr:hypothetical protein Iba_scaffold6854CG0080 [Ipomoea batatas]
MEGAVTKRFHDFFCAFFAVPLFLHRTPDVEICDVIPPNPGVSGLICNPVNTKLPQVLKDYILSFIPFPKILFWISSYSTRSSGWGIDSVQSILITTSSPFFRAAFKLSPKDCSIKADGIPIFSMYPSASELSSGESIVIRFSSMVSATKTAAAPACCPFQTFNAK